MTLRLHLNLETFLLLLTDFLLLIIFILNTSSSGYPYFSPTPDLVLVLALDLVRADEDK